MFEGVPDEDAWRDAEEIAAIADAMFDPLPEQQL